MASIKIGLVGLGRMGLAVAYRLIQAGHEVIGFDHNEAAQQQATSLGVQWAERLADVGMLTRIIWLMVPAGKPVDDVLQELMPTFQPGDVVIDGGNSFFKDSVRRYALLAEKKISFIDCG